MPKELLYSVQIQKMDGFHQIAAGVYALADCNEHGQLIKKFVIVELLSPATYVCSCNKDLRLDLLAAYDAGQLTPHANRPCCLHIQEVNKLTSDDPDLNNPLGPTHIYRLTDTMLATYCEATRTYGILTEGPRTMKCLTCVSKVTTCSHVKAYKQHAMDEGFDPLAKKATDIFTCISSMAIDYPLSDSDTLKFTGYAEGCERYPDKLIPSYNANQRCSHGHVFNKGDPVAHGWITNAKTYVHLKHTTLQATLYHRPSTGSCSCRQEYDGRDDLLLNLNAKHIFTYSWLFDILHDTQETRYPLAAAFRSASRTRTVCGGQPLPESCYDLLRHAYNCFLRLLNLDFEQLFECNQCGPDIDCVIMDGIMMGSRKDLVPQYDAPTVGTTVISECAISDRVFLTDPAARKKLAAYAALNNGRYSICQPLTAKQFKELCLSLKNVPSLQTVVTEAGRKCPKSHQKLLGELSRGSATCGILQLPKVEQFKETRLLLEKASQGDFDQIARNLDLFQRTCPILCDILTAKDIRKDALSALLSDLIKSADCPFTRPIPDDSSYGSMCTSNDVLEFFPSRPLLRGKGNYQADLSKSALTTGCRKDTIRHASLTPGLFTMFCPHGVCLGFQLMDQAESPRTAFDILMRRFDRLPRMIIYDNACKLHLYCLKREPSRFANTRFLVDRLHYRKGHVGCTLGYSMDEYHHDEAIAAINSQANEQANASLRRLATQLTYMPPYNVIKHTSVFLALRNIDKMLHFL